MRSLHAFQRGHHINAFELSPHEIINKHCKRKDKKETQGDAEHGNQRQNLQIRRRCLFEYYTKQ